MKISLAKFKAILLYFTNNTNIKYLGKVKLMKLFYFLDFTHVKNYGAPVTYDTYIKLEHGPIPTTIKNLIDTADEDLDNSAIVDVISIERPAGTDMVRILPNRKFSKQDEKYFSEIELKTLQEITSRFGEKNTKYIEEASHKEAPWKMTNFLEEIPYTLAAQDPDCKVDEEDIELLTQIA